jgi:hypothetical protein
VSHICHATQSFDSAEDTWPQIHQHFRSNQSNLPLAPNNTKRGQKRCLGRVADLNPHCCSQPSLSSRKCSASRLFAIVGKLLTLGIYLRHGLGTVGGSRGIRGTTPHFWLMLRRLQRRGCAFSGFAPKCAAPTNAV